MTSVQVINQGSMLRAMRATGPQLAQAKLIPRGGLNTSRLSLADDKTVEDLDPDGVALVQVHFIHGDGDELRILAMFKLKDREEPCEGKLTMPFGVATSLMHSQEVES